MNLPELHKSIQKWYQYNGRKSLPWRNSQDAYAIYVSEIMLQQTQVKTVLDRYYHPFLETFPTLDSLANAPQEKVLKAWEGLGYYSRAVNLHKAAKLAAPELPNSVEALIALPGIGRNTAHAIAAFAFHKPVPVMEANVKRVLYRFFAEEKMDEKSLWQHAEILLDKAHPFDYNQAMMDIGSMVCTKRQPQCSQCPLSAECLGKESPYQYPAPKLAKKIPIRKKHIVVFKNTQGQFYLQPRTSRFLHGLYQFVESQEKELEFNGEFFCVGKKHIIGKVKQTYSHFQLQADIYQIEIAANCNKNWFSKKELELLPLSKAEQKIVQLLR